MGRTLNIKNKKDETVAFAAKSTKALIMTQVRRPHQNHKPIASTDYAGWWSDRSNEQRLASAEHGSVSSAGGHRPGHPRVNHERHL